MRVKGPNGPTATEAIRRPQRAAPADVAAPAQAVDPVEIAGVPEAELTPRVRAALSNLMQEVSDLRRQISEARAKMAELESLASADPLLGVLNRRAFVAELSRALAMVQRYGQASSLVFIDVDDLKKINDRHGHAAGDAALKHAAEIIAKNVRQTDVFARLGGDEFALILTNTPYDMAMAKAGSLAALVRQAPVDVVGTIGVTLGVVEMSGDATVESALAAADKLMYENKKRR